ncbi:peptide-methionine (S)-S-oxide reductase [Patescibacteria group bacterium]|nr:peptide-methionine (S)-S-oxide reductase [Patescibacteria group bacterium]
MSFDPGAVLCDELLKIFWGNHDPITRNQQRSDIVERYRSIIFYQTPKQKDEQ